VRWVIQAAQKRGRKGFCRENFLLKVFYLSFLKHKSADYNHRKTKNPRLGATIEMPGTKSWKKASTKMNVIMKDNWKAEFKNKK